MSAPKAVAAAPSPRRAAPLPPPPPLARPTARPTAPPHRPAEPPRPPRLPPSSPQHHHHGDYDAERRRAGDALKARALAAQSARELLALMPRRPAAATDKPDAPGPPPLPTPHAVAVLAVRLAHVLQAGEVAAEDDEADEAERALCDLLCASAPRMQFQNVAGALGALGGLVGRRQRPGRRREAQHHQSTNDNQLSAARDALAARLAQCPVAREARGGGGGSGGGSGGGTQRGGYWLSRAAVGLAQTGSPDARAWARVAALAGTLAPRLSGREVGAVGWALGRSSRCGGGGDESDDDDDDDSAAAASNSIGDGGGAEAVLEFAVDALATRAAELAAELSAADLCSALVGLARAVTASSLAPASGAAASPSSSSSASPLSSLPQGVAAALPVLGARVLELAEEAMVVSTSTTAPTTETRHIVGFCFALARLERGLPARRRLAARPPVVAALVRSAAAAAAASSSSSSAPLDPHEACVLCWSVAALSTHGAKEEAEASQSLARRALVSVALPAIFRGGGNEGGGGEGGRRPRPPLLLAPHDAAMLSSALAGSGLGGAAGRRLAAAAARGLAAGVDGEGQLGVRTVLTALWALTRPGLGKSGGEGGGGNDDDDDADDAASRREVADAVRASLLPRCEALLLMRPQALPPRELVVLALALGAMLPTPTPSPPPTKERTAAETATAAAAAGGSAAQASEWEAPPWFYGSAPLQDSDAATSAAALRCLELLAPSLRAACRRLGSRELAAVAWCAGVAGLVVVDGAGAGAGGKGDAEGGAGDDPSGPWPRQVVAAVAAALLSRRPSPALASAKAWEVSRVLWGAAAAGYFVAGGGGSGGTSGGGGGERALWQACGRRLLALLHRAPLDQRRNPEQREQQQQQQQETADADSAAAVAAAAAAAASPKAPAAGGPKKRASGDRLGAASVARAAWALVASGEGVRQRALVRALAGRANVLLALGSRPAGGSGGRRGQGPLSPELVVAPRDAARLARALGEHREALARLPPRGAREGGGGEGEGDGVGDGGGADDARASDGQGEGEGEGEGESSDGRGGSA